MKFYIPYLRLENPKTTSSLVAHDPLYQTRREKGVVVVVVVVGGGGGVDVSSSWLNKHLNLVFSYDPFLYGRIIF